jgi:hypothetical protein
MAPSPTIAPVFLQALRELGWDGATCNIKVDPQGRLGLCLPPSSMATADIVCDIFILLLTIVSLSLVLFLVQKGAFLEMLLVCLPTRLSVCLFDCTTVCLLDCLSVSIFSFCALVCPSVCPPVCPSVSPIPQGINS